MSLVEFKVALFPDVIILFPSFVSIASNASLSELKKSTR